MRRRWLLLGTITLAVALVLAGSGWFAARAFIGSPDAVQVVVSRVQPTPTAPGPMTTTGQLTFTTILDRTLTSQAMVIYRQMIASGPFGPNYAQSCPSMSATQPYYHYALTYYHLGVRVARATSDGIGCEDIYVVYLGGFSEVYFWADQHHTSFWALLHRQIGAPEPPYS